MNILIIGDSCEDIFVYGEIERISSEAPVPIFQPVRETRNGGMSSNVYNNLKSLGANVKLVTNNEKITKTRYIDQRSNQMVLRVDTNDRCKNINKKIRLNIYNNNYQGVEYDAIIISDYCKGFLSETDITLLCKHNNNIFLDTKKKFTNFLKYADYIKINDLEFKNNFDLDFFDNLRETNLNLRDPKFKEKIIITQGRHGCLYNGKEYLVKEVGVRDVTGAGDTFISSLVYKYVETKDIIESINFAQMCTTIVVQKHGVSIVTQEDLKKYE